MTLSPRPAAARRSVRLALVAGAALAVAIPSAVGAGTGDTKPPVPSAPATTAADSTAATPTTATGASTAATEGSTPAAGAVEPLAVVDIGATGPGVDVGSVIEGPTAVANLALTDMPIAEGATVAEYAANYTANLSDPETPSYSGSMTIISSAQSEMPAADILAAYQAALGTLGEFESTTGTASSEGVTSDRLELDPVVDDAAAETTTAGAVPRPLSSYDVTVTRAEENPGLVAIEVVQTISSIDGPAPEIPEAVAGDFTTPLAFAEAQGWTVTGWSYRDGFNQFFGGSPLKSAELDLSAGAGTVEDLPALGDILLAEFGATTYESVDTESISYTFEDESSWYLSFRDYQVGNEMNLSWSKTLS